MEEWVGDDFPNKRRKPPRGINLVLQWYSNGRKFIFTKKPLSEDVEPVCCDGISGLCGLIFLLLIDVAYVTWCIICSKLETEDDIRLVWLSILVWIVIIFKIIRRLIRLGRLRGGCFAPFATFGDWISRIWHNFKNSVKGGWQSMWNRIEPDKRAQKRKKRLAIRL